MLSSVHSELAFNEHINNNKNKTRQLILAYAALGRHADIVIHSIVSKLLKSMEDANDTIDIINLIHALGNTGSKKAIPYLLPFLYNSNNRLQQKAVVDSVKRFHSAELTKFTISYLKHVDTDLAIELREDLQDGLNVATTRAKRGLQTTTD